MLIWWCMEERLKELRENLTRLGQGIGVGELRARIQALEAEMSRPEFWNDRVSAQAKAKELEAARERLENYEALLRELEDIEVLWQLAQEEDDEAAREEAQARLTELAEKFTRARMEFLLTGPYDPNDCFLSINAGAGGTDAMDWAEMLLRMYTRFCERAGFDARLVDETPGEEAGIKSATLEVRGRYAYGILKG
ncbi:MAG: PCRF domain-containing protein, partial [Candidatus Bipolaricaulaceae bacterium]